MFRLFGFGASRKRVGAASLRPRPAQPAAYAEALQAGWVPPLPEVRTRIGPVDRGLEEKSDIAAFLARVYRNQQC
jgi:hypothetical protein